MHLPIRGKYTKKHGRVVAKFDHYCYMLGNSVGELNHGLFYRFLFVQVSGRSATGSPHARMGLTPTSHGCATAGDVDLAGQVAAQRGIPRLGPPRGLDRG